jgi:biopolymer transport protein ExbB/TolQ
MKIFIKNVLRKYLLWGIFSIIPIFYSYTSFVVYKESLSELKFKRIILKSIMQSVKNMDKNSSVYEKKEITDNFIEFTNKLDEAKKKFNKQQNRLQWSFIFIFVYFGIFVFFKFIY